MSRLFNLTFDPDDPRSISEALTTLSKVVDSKIEFGHPTNPDTAASTTLAGAGTPTTHNGTLQNIRGTWVEVAVAAAGTFTVNHNLDVNEFVSGEPNVRWIVMGLKHSGAGPATGTLSVEFDSSVDSVTANSIDLELRSNGTRTIASGANAVHVSLFVIPAVRWP